MKKSSILGIAVLLTLISGWYVYPTSTELRTRIANRHKGVCWVGGHDTITVKELEPLVGQHVTWISQTPFGWQSSASQPEIRLNTHADKVWWGESDLGISETTRMANQLEIKTLLKPHLWIRNSWPGEVMMDSDEEWDQWFENYATFILHYARLAEENHVEVLCIGTELLHTIGHELRWRNLITEIRKVYGGKLTYAANFNAEFEKVKFWDALDFIGIQAYFPLSQKENPTLDELKLNWVKPLRAIENVSKLYDKPVLFTEIGYRSTADAAIEPWRWPQDNREAAVSNNTQALCYNAFFEMVWEKPWLAGAYFWKWYPFGPRRLAEIDFTPQGKPAQDVLKYFFEEAHDD
ncbi:MAG: hypothetical protein RIB47_13470 [Cyclobacteriaceae bacterium]